MYRAVSFLLVVLFGAIFAGGSLLAQSTDEINSVVQFEFSKPGARSLGMAGAFTARADDATAAYANPAGLTQLAQLEVALEGRGWRFNNEFLDSGALSLDAGQPVLDQATFGETGDSVEGVSFGSIMYPGASGRWTIGGFRHELVNYETEVNSSGLATADSLVRPLSAAFDLEIESVGVSAAGTIYRSADRSRNFNVGVTLAFSQFDLSSRTERLDDLRGQEDPGNLASADAPTGLLDDLEDGCCQFENRGDVRFFETQSGDDDDLSFVAGALWTAERYSIGAVYREGARFEFSANSYERVVKGQTGQRAFPSRGPWRGAFKVPDSWGLGLSGKLTDRLTLAVAFDRIEYSDLVRRNLDLTGKDRNVSGTACEPDEAFTCQGQVGRARDFVLGNGSEYRVGFEYALPTRDDTTWFFRGGGWLDPDHAIRYRGPLVDQRSLFLPQGDKFHGAAGFGVRLRRLQVDAGIDLSDRVNTVALSGTLYFGAD